MINLDGEAIGVNAMKVTPGISFAIPIDYAKEFLNKSKQRKEGKRSRRFMGITMLTITPDVIHELRQKMNFPRDLNSGIIVYRVVVDSPSDNAGIRPGDIITHINGMQMRQTSQVFELLESNVDLELIVRRGDQTLKMTVKPE